MPPELAGGTRARLAPLLCSSSLPSRSFTQPPAPCSPHGCRKMLPTSVPESSGPELRIHSPTLASNENNRAFQFPNRIEK